MGDDSRYYFSYDNFDPSTAWAGGGGRTVNVNSTTNSVANLNYLDADHGKEDMIKNYFKNADAGGPIPELFTSGYFKLRFKFYGVRDNTTAFTLNNVAGKNLYANGFNSGELERYPDTAAGVGIPLFEPVIFDYLDGEIIDYTVTVKNSSEENITAAVYNSATKKLTFAEPGTYKIVYGAQDSSGNQADAVQKEITVHGALSLSIDAEYPSSYEYGTELTVIAASSNRAVDPEIAVSVKLNGGDLTANASGQYELSALGTVTVKYSATDGYESYAELVRTFTVVDTQKPTISVTGTYADVVEGAAIDLLPPTVTDACDGSIQTYTVTVKNSSEEDITVAVYNSATKKLTFAAPGTYKIVYGAQDSSGNQADAVQKEITVTEQKFTVTFDSGGGSAVAAITDVARNAAIAAPVAPKKRGHTFAGWYKDSGFTDEWNFSTDTVTADITLYAKWSLIRFTVTVHYQNGETVVIIKNFDETMSEADIAALSAGGGFGGLYSDAEFVNAYDPASAITGDIDLYVKAVEAVQNDSKKGCGSSAVGVPSAFVFAATITALAYALSARKRRLKAPYPYGAEDENKAE
jgi:uncharacterized repeat protein (TIGR02543 family)